MKTIVKKLFLVFTIVSCFKIANAQNINYIKNYFRFPLDIPASISGTFGEIRNNHFHSGIDFRTQEKEGYKVFAVADGYVSRIRVSAWGFGNALYITHNNGYMSVYGHLLSFNSKITDYLRQKQYETQSFEQDLHLSHGKIRVKKGEVIALSGNSGSSEGPHLHFELRDIKTEKPVNPFLFGYQIPDTIPPLILKFGLFYNNNSLIYQVLKKSDNYYLNIDTLYVYDNFYTGIEAYDLLNNSKSRNGIYKLELFFDSILNQSITFNTFSFDETRFVNALINYPVYYTEKNKIMQSRILPGNKLSLYKVKSGNNEGWFKITDKQVHKISYKVYDFSGNLSQITIPVKKIDDTTIIVSEKKDPYFVKKIAFNKNDTLSTESFMAVFPENSLYEDINLSYHYSVTSKSFLSPIHELHNRLTPIHKNIAIYIKPDTLIENLTEKMLIVRIDGDNKQVSVGGKFENGFIKTNINNFGKFAVVIDTVAPKIKTLNFKNNENVSKLKELKVLLTDNLSGISSYNAFLNDKWVLMEYDGKTSQLTYKIDERLLSGQNLLKIVVEDSRKNKSELELKIFK